MTYFFIVTDIDIIGTILGWSDISAMLNRNVKNSGQKSKKRTLSSHHKNDEEARKDSQPEFPDERWINVR